MDHSLYRPEDFACDESYLRYYFKLNDKDIGYWEHWIRTHPEKLDVIMSADQLIGFLSLQLPEDEFQQEYERFTRAIAKSALQESGRSIERKGIEILPVPGKRAKGRRRRTGAWLVLASVLLVAGGGWLFEYHHGTPSATLAGNVMTRSNTTAYPMDISLEEGTRVKLDPGARLSWPEHFLPGKREVTLDGAAFFEVSRDPRHPFYVYCHDLVVHVIGTGFFVTANKQDNTVEVSVSSGKVEVYEKLAVAPKGDFPQKVANGVVLTPNQKVIYAGNSREFEATLVDKPLPLVAEAATDFREARLYAVIQSLQRVYGIDIEVEDETMYECHFSGRLGNTSLYEALTAVCQSLNMTWEIKETKIVLRGRGCDTP